MKSRWPLSFVRLVWYGLASIDLVVVVVYDVDENNDGGSSFSM